MRSIAFGESHSSDRQCVQLHPARLHPAARMEIQQTIPDGHQSREIPASRECRVFSLFFHTNHHHSGKGEPCRQTQLRHVRIPIALLHPHPCLRLHMALMDFAPPAPKIPAEFLPRLPCPQHIRPRPRHPLL